MALLIIIASLIIGLLIFNAIMLVDIKISLDQFYNVRNTKPKQFADSANGNDSKNIY